MFNALSISGILRWHPNIFASDKDSWSRAAKVLFVAQLFELTDTFDKLAKRV